MHLDVPQAARLFGVSEDLVYDWIRNESLPASFYGDRYYINKVKLLGWAQRQQLPLPLEGDLSEPILEHALSRGVYLLGAEVSEFPGAIRLLLRNALDGKIEDLSRPFEMIVARDGLGWEPIAQYAVPLPAAPIIRPGAEASVHFAAFVNEIPWLTNQVTLKGAWLIFAPVPACHVNLVTRISVMLRDAKISSLLQRGGSRDELLDRLKEMSVDLKTGESKQINEEEFFF